ncbi:pentapeptide repeat-containing protein [Microtetraspora malaysiensis]|uniref:pentapeptide repeat-containing protein n=1 Tax=Microtetraspora malaysiensis TaxID=161358 RepID=UPI003D935BCC
MIFSRCDLREARFSGSDLSKAAFDECNLHLAEFDGGTYRGCDLRSNDLSSLRGVSVLKKIIIDFGPSSTTSPRRSQPTCRSASARTSKTRGPRGRRHGLTTAVRPSQA